MCHRAHLEVKGQLPVVSSFLPRRDQRSKFRSSCTHGKRFCPPSHLPSSVFYISERNTVTPPPQEPQNSLPAVGSCSLCMRLFAFLPVTANTTHKARWAENRSGHAQSNVRVCETIENAARAHSPFVIVIICRWDSKSMVFLSISMCPFKQLWSY